MTSSPSDQCQVEKTLQYPWVMRENLLLADYATHSVNSKGRRQPEAHHPYRGPFQRDRDRILHCSAFRRLSGKMQVFTGEMGDYHRTRLTHTQEVATIARTIGRVLRLNEDLIEALALLHDIGHPPFGHSGEEALNERLIELGGFSHNQFGLTIVEQLESRYTLYPGLNLSFEVLEGQDFRITHQGQLPSLEAQVVDLADSIAYNAHDADDSMKLGLLGFDQLSSLALVQRAMAWREPLLLAPQFAQVRNKLLVHHLIEVQVADLLENAIGQVAGGGESTKEKESASRFELTWSKPMEEERKAFSRFLFENVYRHPQLSEVRSQASQRIKELFDKLVDTPKILPPRFQVRSQSIGTERAAAEYIGGMTDRFCSSQHRHLIELGGQVAEDWQ
jgi:dGTPase